MSPRELHLDKIAGVFRGKEAKHNGAIFRILANQGPQGYYDLRRLIEKESLFTGEKSVSYSVINRRVRALERGSYIEKVGSKKSKAGVDIPIFALSLKGSLAALLLENREDLRLGKFLDNMSENPICRLAGFLTKKGINEDFVWNLFIEGVKSALVKGLVNLDVAEVSDIIIILNSSLLRRLNEISDRLSEEKETLDRTVEALKTEDGRLLQAEIYGTAVGLQLDLSSFVAEKTDLNKSTWDALVELEENRKKIAGEGLGVAGNTGKGGALKNLRYLCEMFEMMHYGWYEFFKYHLETDTE